MANATSVLETLPKNVRIRNPHPGGSKFTNRKRALRFLLKEHAYLDACGWLVFYGAPEGVLRGSPEMMIVGNHSGLDAFPGRAVMPPSGEVLAKLASRRGGPVRPPLVPHELVAQ